MPDVTDAIMSEARDIYMDAVMAEQDSVCNAIPMGKVDAAARVLAEWAEKVRAEELERCLKVVGVYDILHHNICESIIEEIRSLP